MLIIKHFYFKRTSILLRIFVNLLLLIIIYNNSLLQNVFLINIFHQLSIFYNVPYTLKLNKLKCIQNYLLCITSK